MYLLDTNVFIDAYHKWYQRSFCPGFWTWLQQSAQNNRIGLVRAVVEEIQRKDDGIYGWLRVNGLAAGAIGDDGPSNQAVGQLINWAQSKVGKRYTDHAVTEFADRQRCADAFLIATALAHGHAVVTGETRSGWRHGAHGRQNRVLIPDVCDVFHVQVLDLPQLLAQLAPQFVLAGET